MSSPIDDKLERKRMIKEAYVDGLSLKKTTGYSRDTIIRNSVGNFSSPHYTTINRWKNKDMSLSSQKERLKRCGRQSKWSEDQKKVVIGYAVDLRLESKAVSLETITNFTNYHLTPNMSETSILRLLKSYNFTSQKAMVRNSRLVSEEVVDDAIKFLLKVRDMNLEPDQLVFMDETGLWSNHTPSRTYNPKSRYEILILLKLTDFPFFVDSF